jgi:hypothetical protein
MLAALRRLEGFKNLTLISLLGCDSSWTKVKYTHKKYQETVPFKLYNQLKFGLSKGQVSAMLPLISLIFIK